MNLKALTMKKEIRSIAKHRALLISKYYLALLLLPTSLYLSFLKYALSPFYIFILLYGMPPILNSAIKDYSVRHSSHFLKNITEDTPFLLNHLKVKYKYSTLSYFTNSISYFFALLLIGLWQYNFSSIIRIHPVLQVVPAFILFTALTLRYLGIVFYQIKLPIDLSHNRV